MASGLGALIAQQKKSSDQTANAGALAKPSESPKVEDQTPPSKALGDTQSTSQEKVNVAPVKANPFGRKAASGGESQAVAAPGTAIGVAATGISDATTPATSRLAGINLGGNSQDNGPGDSGNVADLDLSDLSLESLCASEDPGLALSPTRSQFADETPATKPTRTLPPELEKQQLQFVDLLDGMYEIVHDPELLGNVVKSMMIEWQSNPQYAKLIVPSDIRLVVRAARESMGLARVKKTEAKAKRASGGSRVSKTVDQDMMADLADLGIAGLE